MALRVAVVHDYLTQRGGAERVALALWRAFPGARLITSVYDAAGTFPEFADADVETSWLQRLAPLRRDPRRALPLLPGAFDRLALDDVDVAVCSSTGFAHGIPTRAPKLVYCHNPPRWLYQSEDYLLRQPAPVRAALAVLRPRLTAWDKRAAASASRYVVNSTVVQERVQRTYGIPAAVVPPPVAVDVQGAQRPVEGVRPGFFLAVGRPRGYKNTDVVCRAFAAMPDLRLVVVGGLPDHEAWPENVRGVTDISDEELRWLYAHCAALVSVAHEDFGLAPVEANAFGRPALVLRAGGFLDTLVEGVTGHFVERVDPQDVAGAVRRLLAAPLDPGPITAHAATYSLTAFTETLRREVAALVG